MTFDAKFEVTNTEMDAQMGAVMVVDVGAVVPKSRLSAVNLLASKWIGEDGLYSQIVTVEGATSYSKVDLLPSVEQLAIFHEKDIAFVTENDDGVVTVYAIGDRPTQDYTIQVQLTEVIL